MIANLKDFTIGVLGSLFATFLTTYTFQFIKLGKAFNFKAFLNIVINYKFLIYWILLLICIIMIRWFIRNTIDKLQTPFPMIMGFGGDYDLEFKGEAYGFNWISKAYIEVKIRLRMRY